jgi:hypothetical protein
MMNRDPLAELTQRRSLTNEHLSSPVAEPEIQTDSPPVVETNLIREKDEAHAALGLDIQKPSEPIVETSFTRDDDEERVALELAIQKSLEDQQEVDNDVSNSMESSSDSDGKFNR